MNSRGHIVIILALVAAALVGTQATVRAGEGTDAAAPPAKGHDVAIFAGGCFWCMETAFEGVEGVVSVLSGYTGGYKDHPTYEEVWQAKTGHAESVLVEYDPTTISYEKLLDIYWHNIDPASGDGQFCDRGFSYRPEIFCTGEAQMQAAEKSKQEIEAMHVVPKVDVRISPASTFWVAEEYHQDYYKKNPEHYHQYREGCGRDRRLAQIWGKSDH